MVPLCRDCQGVVSTEVTTRAVLLQQQKLTCDIEALIDANFKACNAFKQMDNKVEIVQGEYEGIATLLGEMQQQLNRLDKKIDDATLNVCKKVSSFLDDVAPADNASTLVKIDALTSVTQQIGESQSMIGERLKDINTELIFLSERDPGPAVNEILEEVKAISANLPSGTEQTKAHHETLADELASSSASGSPNLKDNSGWRTLGNKRLWKADWTDYDIRTARRKEQFKLRRKAKQRKRRHQHRRSSYTGTDDLDHDYELDYRFFDNNFHLEQRNDRLHRLGHNQLAQHFVKQPVNLLQNHQQPQPQEQEHQQHNQHQQQQSQQYQHRHQHQQPQPQQQRQQSQQLLHQPQQQQHLQQHSQHQQQQSQQRQHQPQQHQHQSQQHQQQQLHQLQQPYQNQQQQQQHQQLQQPSLQQPQQAHPLQQQHQQQHLQQQPHPHQQQHHHLQQQQQQAQVYNGTPSWMFQPALRSSFSEIENF